MNVSLSTLVSHSHHRLAELFARLIANIAFNLYPNVIILAILFRICVVMNISLFLNHAVDSIYLKKSFLLEKLDFTQ